MQTKEFATADVMSVVTGVLMGKIAGVYEVLNWMTDDELMTHQLPYVGREAGPVIVAAHPSLAVAIEEAQQVTHENCQEWLRTWEARYGATIAVPKFDRKE